MKNMYLENSLKYDISKCNGCGMCSKVCPHGVFIQQKKRAKLAHPSSCMECGACRQNCPRGAIIVNSGVGCAAAMIQQALTGRAQPCCGCDSD